MVRVTAAEASRNLSEILDRVQYRDESFEISRDDQVVATITKPHYEGKPIGALIRWLAKEKYLDDDDAADFEMLIDEQRREKPQADPEWG